MPAPVRAARILLGIDAVASLLLSVFSFAGTALIGSFASSTAAESAPGADSAGLGHLAEQLTLVSALFVSLAVAELALLSGISKGRGGARVAMTVVLAADLVLSIVMAGLDQDSPTGLLFGVPWTGLILGLLWLPASSTRYFSTQPGSGALRVSLPTIARPTSGGGEGHIQYNIPGAPRGSQSILRRFLCRKKLSGAVITATLLSIIAAVIYVGFNAHAWATESLAEGTWSCNGQGEEGQDVYGNSNSDAFDVVIGDGTFSVPSRDLSGTWTYRDGLLQITSTWRRGDEHAIATSTVEGAYATNLDNAEGASSFKTSFGATSLDRPIDWTFSNGEFTVKDRTSVADPGLSCTKTSSS